MATRDDLLPVLPTRDVVRTLAGVLGPLLLAIVALALSGFDPGAAPTLYVLKDYFYVAVIGGGIFALAVARPGASWRAIGFRPCPVDWLVRGFLLGVMLFGLHLVAEAALRFIGIARTEPRASDSAIITAGSSTGLAVALSVAIVVLTPIFVETFARGLLFGWLRRHVDFFLSALASSIVFGVLHIEVVRYGQAAVFGIVAAWVYERSGSLWPAIALHATLNFAYWMSLS